MQLRVDLAASVAKDPERPDLNEDAYALGSNRIALADGASESYDSKTWARLLTEAYIHDQRVGELWVADRVRAYVESVDYTSLSWSKQAAFDRGSFATLVGLEVTPNSHDLKVVAIGDSLVAHVRDGALLASFPFQTPEEFDSRPQLLSTLSFANEFVSESDFFVENSVTWPLLPGDHLLLMTDAVGHWLLSQSEALTHLSAVTSTEEFQRLVVAQRQSRHMRLDDSTLLRIVVEAKERDDQA